MQVLVDSDVILDFVLQRDDFALDANIIFEYLGNRRFEAFVCPISFPNVFYFVRKANGKDAAFQAIRDLLVSVRVCKVDKSVLDTALILNFSDYEDAVQCASAVAENLGAIVTRNIKHYKKSPIPVYLPADFLKVLQNESVG